MQLITKLLAMNPLDITPELAMLRDSLLVERLNETSDAIKKLLENT